LEAKNGVKTKQIFTEVFAARQQQAKELKELKEHLQKKGENPATIRKELKIRKDQNKKKEKEKEEEEAKFSLSYSLLRKVKTSFLKRVDLLLFASSNPIEFASFRKKEFSEEKSDKLCSSYLVEKKEKKETREKKKT